MISAGKTQFPRLVKYRRARTVLTLCGKLMQVFYGSRKRRALIVCCKLSLLMLSPLAQLKLYRLFTSPHLICLCKVQPRLLLKYLGSYLFINHRRTDRLAALLFHYEYLTKHTSSNFFHAILNIHPCLWREQYGNDEMRIALSFPLLYDREGDLALDFYINSEPVYTVSFSILSGKLINQPNMAALCISRLQGSRDFQLLKQATACCHEVTPAAALMAAVEGLAMALQIRTAICISSKESLSNNHSKIIFDYDDFWEAMGATRYSDQLFSLPIPLPCKSLDSVTAKHRSRTRRKRAFKAEIASAAHAYLLEHFVA